MKRSFKAVILAAALVPCALTVASAAQDAGPARPSTIVCVSKIGERQHCSADTSSGVALLRSMGEAPCLLGKTWGYDDTGIWVSEGCGGEFVAGQPTEEVKEAPKKEAPEYIPNVGFRLYEGEKGQIYMRLFTYARYLNQKALDDSYTDFFGNTHSVKQRQDAQLNKFFLPFTGWFLDPKFRYYLYVWSANTAQGDDAQVVGAGNVSYTINRFVSLGAGITSLPSVRSTEGQFPYWLGVDDRLTSDEFFRGSYTTGFWAKGEISTKLKYMAMIANNLSTLGVSASQLDNGFNTTALSLQWLPTTGEFGPYAGFGDYERHDKFATRFGLHYTHSREDNQAQPATDAIENSQIRLTDGSVIFTPDLFGPGITVDRVSYEMVSVDAGFKYKGFAVEGEYYWRNLAHFSGSDTEGIDEIDDQGWQLQTSAMLIRDTLQFYVSGGEILGDFGDSSELRAGLSYWIFKKRGVRLNVEEIHLNHCPVGYTAVPYPVGGDGNIFHFNVEMNF